jgi:hypothetical protein
VRILVPSCSITKFGPIRINTVATSTPLAEPAAGSVKARSQLHSPARSPLIYWHLLSLDAPSVAMVWTWFIARTSDIHLPATSILAMGLAVWALYAADRLLDSATASRSAATHSLEVRHLFHRHHQWPFRAGILACSLGLGFLVPRLPASSIHLYTILGALLVAYLLLIHLPQRSMPRLPKEIAVGIFFSAAAFIPTVARNPALRWQLLPAAMLFGLACSLNCLFIYAWEHPVTGPLPSTQGDAHPATRLALSFLPQISALVLLTCLGLMPFASPAVRELFFATAAAVAFLLVLHRFRRYFDATTLRAAADLCLLTPIVFALTRLP